MYSWPTSNKHSFLFSSSLLAILQNVIHIFSYLHYSDISRDCYFPSSFWASAITSAQQQFPSNCAKSACYFISIKLFVFFVEWNYTRNTCPPRYVSMNIYLLHIHRVCCHLTRSYSCMFVVYWKSASPACNLWSNPFPISPRARTRRRKIAAIWFWFQGRWMW